MTSQLESKGRIAGKHSRTLPLQEEWNVPVTLRILCRRKQHRLEYLNKNQEKISDAMGLIPSVFSSLTSIKKTYGDISLDSHIN